MAGVAPTMAGTAPTVAGAMPTMAGRAGPDPFSLAPKNGAPAAAPPPVVGNADPYIGRTLVGKFMITDLLGEGGMGKVYRARHLNLDKTVCIKVLRPALLEDKTVVGRFEREAKAASRLNHAHSIQVLDFGQDETGSLYIVMEYVSGKDLRKILQTEFPLGEGRICHIVGEVLSALAEAHAGNVIHRDLKPENIMIEHRRDDPDFVKVLDFGIAKIQDPEVPGLTRADVVCGTPLYMSPEQATGSALDARSDLYAMGVILYQLTTGVLPFDGQNSMEILTKHVMDLPIPPRMRRPEVAISEDMEALILRALEKDPKKRPQTAEAFREELLQIEEKQKEARKAATAAVEAAKSQFKNEREQAMKDRHAAQLEAMGRKTPGTAAATGYAATGVTAPPPPKSKVPMFVGIGVGVVAVAAAGFVLLHPSTPAPAPVPVPAPPPVVAVAPPPPPAPAPVVTSAPPPPTPTPGSDQRVLPGTVASPPPAPAPAPAPAPHRNPAAAKKLVDEEADPAYFEDKFSIAIKLYRRAIAEDPTYAAAYKGLYKAGIGAQDKAAIREGGRGYLKLSPNSSDAESIRTGLSHFE
jgi:tRNA A-37 threonylcarbamoyl transferase component Bud32